MPKKKGLPGECAGYRLDNCYGRQVIKLAGNVLICLNCYAYLKYLESKKAIAINYQNT